jgi:unsaturated chondroitin disaccharide hydrolase
MAQNAGLLQTALGVNRMPDSFWLDAIARMRARIDYTAPAVKDGFPHYADPATGKWTTTPAGDWTGGYWNGMLWLTAYATADQGYIELAENWTARLRPRLKSKSAAKGLLFYYGAALGAILCANSPARELAIDGARSLAAMYNPRAQVIPTGAEFEEVHSVGDTESEVDIVQIVALLTWASRETGEASLREIGVNHARRHVELCLREDGSICQSASIDAGTGEVTRRYTHKGITDHSTWARAQAWGILGWALAAQWSGDSAFLEPAERAAEWWMRHLPDDRVAFWDFDDPAIPHTHRDSSATAIASAGMLKLAALSQSASKRDSLKAAAEASARALVTNYLGAEGGLWHGCYNKRINLAVDDELIWGSYYLYEALHVLAGKLQPARI